MSNLSNRPLDRYLNIRSSSQRLDFLYELRSQPDQFLPVSLVTDILHIDIPTAEKVALIQVTSSPDNLELETFLIDLLPQAHQDVAVTALQHWAMRTERLLWYKLPGIVTIAHLPQRLRYRMIEVTPKAGGLHMLEAVIGIDGLEELSSAFHGLLIQRALQWNFNHKRLTAIAVTTIGTLLKDQLANDKGLPTALGYLARFAPDELQKIRLSESTSESWRPILASISRFNFGAEDKTKLSQFLQKKPSKKFMEGFFETWPCVWQRSMLDTKTTQLGLERIIQFMSENRVSNYETYPMNWQAFAGIDAAVVCDALMGIKDDEVFSKALNLLEGQIPFDLPQELVLQTVKRMQLTSNPQAMIENFPPRVRFELSQHGRKNVDETYKVLVEDRKQALHEISQTNSEKNLSFPVFPARSFTGCSWSEAPEEISDRHQFFEFSFRERAPSSKLTKSFWGALIEAAQNPSDTNLNKLTLLARQAPAFFQYCYLRTLGHFKGNDEATLKLLDYIRTEEEHELRAVMRALYGIGTSRSTMELIASLTRPNMNLSLQTEVADLLKELDLESLQSELRSAIADLNPDENTGPRWELKETLTALLQASNNDALPDETTESHTKSLHSGTKNELDRGLMAKIPRYNDMSSEVRRALRTAEFFHNQVDVSDTHSAIDLSPVIDMQYKAMELTFRELFEGHCKDLIHAGILQRKLDVIGYARPIENAMTEFENYIGNLPIISSVPFFSKFKLRKMLRAICQFRPGRRFTLDGLKAFGLFFLCFGRKTDRYGLENLFPLPFDSDQELYEFTKKLHVFQDVRNRAAHEGFQPDASNDIDAIWQLTSEIVEIAYRIKQALGSSAASSPRSRSGVTGHKPAQGVEIVRKKVS